MEIMMSTTGKKLLLWFIFLIFLSIHEPSYSVSAIASVTLEVGFYQKSCPSAEGIVENAVKKAVSIHPGLAASIIRLHFHDCFVRGCDASVLIDSTSDFTAEKDNVQFNENLNGFDVIDEAKAKIEAVCPQTVSCADILAFAARDSVCLAGGFQYAVPAGRRDGTVSLSENTSQNLPPASPNITELAIRFARKGLSTDEMVTLSGAHSVGVAHCSKFSDRLFNFNSTHAADPSMSTKFAIDLKKMCPRPSSKLGATTDPPVSLDNLTPTTLDNKYYVDLVKNRGLLSSDQILTASPLTANLVRKYVENGSKWAKKFADAMVHMGSIEVLTGNQGEIRKNCRVVN